MEHIYAGRPFCQGVDGTFYTNRGLSSLKLVQKEHHKWMLIGKVMGLQCYCIYLIASSCWFCTVKQTAEYYCRHQVLDATKNAYPEDPVDFKLRRIG